MRPATCFNPATVLRLPLHQRMVVQRGQGDDGQPVLQLFYGDQEISFDEPALFVFGETLARQSRFAAGDATHWTADGDTLAWPQVHDLLAQLLESGVLQFADDTGDASDPHLADAAGERPSPLPPALTTQPRSWHALPGLMTALVGRPLEIGWLELVVPIFRVAHMALDADGRQVGEANVFPPMLRLDVPTRWRTCIYPGSRHLHEKPMNVSALKAMRAHWGPMMAMLLRVRAAYLRRCPDALAGWTVGHLERLSTAVLTLPAWQLMRSDKRVADGALHPVLSSMFRVTDGLRMTMHHMLFIPFGEPTRHPDTPMTAAEVHAYAERAFSFISDHGVCAGPKAMVDEFLAVLVDGATPRDGLPAVLDPALEAATADIEPAIDYAMLGLQAYAAVFSLWPATMRCYEHLAAQADAWAADAPTPAVLAWQAWLAPIVAQLRSSTHLATEQWRTDRELVYGDMHAQCHRVRTGQWPARTLAACLAPQPVPAGVLQAMQAAVARRFGAAQAGAPAQVHQQALVGTLADYLARAQAVVAQGCAVQQQINQLLGRTPPVQPFQAADIDLYLHLAGETAGRVPFLLDELPQQLGLRADIGAAQLQLHTISRAAPQGAAGQPTCRHGVDNAACPLHALSEE